MIAIGYSQEQKQAAVTRYRAEHDVRRVVVIAPAQFPLEIAGAEQLTWAEVIEYVHFYRMLQETDGHTLIVLNECLRTQERYDLTYNCIRHFLNQTRHQLIFQRLPQIDTREDFMILFDFETQSRWKRSRFDAAMVREQAQVELAPLPLGLTCIDVPTSEATRRQYACERERRFAELGAGDPHTLPRNLHLIGGRDKLAWIDAQPARRYVARNGRLKRESIVTYDAVTADEAPYTVLDCPHRFVDWCDFLARSGQSHADVLVADLKVDRWYFERLTGWKERVCGTYADLCG